MKLSVSPPIDSLLNGGLEPGCVTSLYGPPASGKTNIAKLAAVSCIRSGKKAVYVDTEGGFSMERIEQLTENAKYFLDEIILIEPKEWEEQKSAVRKLEIVCKTENIGIIIIDSISALWRLAITDLNANEINREFAFQLSLLSKIAREKSIPVLITNHVYSDIETGKTEMSSRNVVKWWSKNLIELTIGNETGCRLARIERSRSLPEDKSIKFRIIETGLEEIPELDI